MALSLCGGVALAALLLVTPAAAQKDEPAPPAAPIPPPPPGPPSVSAPAAPAVRSSRVAPPPRVPGPRVVRQRIFKRPVWVHGKRVVDAPLVSGLPIASFPGFTRLEDGKSRIFIEVDAKVDVAERRDPNRLVYRFKNTAVTQHTNALPLVASYFSTPVDRVQLVQDGADVNVVIELREATTPTFQIVETPRGMVLWVDFPRSVSFKPEGPLDTSNVDVEGTGNSAKRITTSTTIGILKGPGGGDPAAPPSAPAAPVVVPATAPAPAQ